MKYYLILFSFLFLVMGCEKAANDAVILDAVAPEYVKLALEIGQYDAYFIDAYYGPEEFKPENRGIKKLAKMPVSGFFARIKQLMAEVVSVNEDHLSDLEKLRKAYLSKQLLAMLTKVEMLGGKKYKFDEEAFFLYDAEPPHKEDAFYKSVLARLDAELPGKDKISERLAEFRKKMIIPSDKLAAVFDAAIQEARRRTLQHIQLPENENFVVEYVKDKPWGAYNWYKGNSYSVIQVNTDLPIYIDRAIDLACHEGYPGHHVYNALLEKHLAVERNWVEFTVYLLFSPQSLIAEGTANFGIEVAFHGDEQLEFEAEVLYPLAGIDPALARKYANILKLSADLKTAGIDGARAYLDGIKSADETVAWTASHTIRTADRARKSLEFYDAYRSYIINYSHGLNLVRAYVEKQGGTADHPEKRWKIFTKLLSEPQVPSLLK